MGWNNITTTTSTTVAPKKNWIINPDFTYAPQTSFAAINGPVLPGWALIHSSDGSYTVTQSTDAPALAAAGRKIRYSMRATVNTADSSIGSTQYAMFYQRLSGYTWANLFGQALVLSFWVRSSVTGLYSVTLSNNTSGGTTDYNVATYNISSADTWEFKTLTYAAYSSGTWNTTTSAPAAILNFTMAVGSGLTASAGSWSTGSPLGVTSHVNAVATTNNIFAIAGVQLEVGSAFSTFETKKDEQYVYEIVENTSALSDGLYVDGSTTGGVLRNFGRSRKNAIINGDMMISQRGTSFAAASGYTIDRWNYQNNSSATVTITQNSDVPTVASAGRYIGNSLRIQVTAADASIAAGEYCLLMQIIEGYLWQYFAQQICTLSFWVRSGKTGTHCVGLRNGGVDRSLVLEYTINTVDTWEFKTLSVPASPSAGTWNYNNTGGLTMSFALSCGSNLQTTSGSWQTGNYLASSNQVNVTDSNSSRFFAITGVQLEVGTGFSGYETRSYQEELTACQRYYWSDSLATGWIGCYNDAVAGPKSVFLFYRPCPVFMRATPTVTIAGAASDYKIRYIGGFNNCSDVPVGVVSSIEGININANLSGSLTATAGVYLIRNTTTANIKVDAEL